MYEDKSVVEAAVATFDNTRVSDYCGGKRGRKEEAAVFGSRSSESVVVVGV